MLQDTFFPLETTDYLQTEFLQRRGRNPHYSLRAFARDLELSPSTLCEFLKGKASLSAERAMELGKKIDLAEMQIEHFADLVTLRFSAMEQRRREARRRIEHRFEQQKSYLPLEKFAVVSNWYHMVILGLVELSDKYHSVEVLAETLDLSEVETSMAVETLMTVGLLVKEGPRWKIAQAQTLVGNQQASGAIRSFHRQMLDQAAKALTELPVEQRNFQSTVFSMRAEDTAAFNKDLEQLMKTLVDKYHSKTGKNLACSLNFQWVPHNPPALPANAFPKGEN